MRRRCPRELNVSNPSFHVLVRARGWEWGWGGAAQQAAPPRARRGEINVVPLAKEAGLTP